MQSFKFRGRHRTERELVHRWLGQDLARKFIESVNSRGKVLDRLVREYNQGFQKVGDNQISSPPISELWTRSM